MRTWRLSAELGLSWPKLDQNNHEDRCQLMVPRQRPTGSTGRGNRSSPWFCANAAFCIAKKTWWFLPRLARAELQGALTIVTIGMWCWVSMDCPPAGSNRRNPCRKSCWGPSSFLTTSFIVKSRWCASELARTEDGTGKHDFPSRLGDDFQSDVS